MSDDFYFDPGEQEGSGFEPFPAGDYPAEIIGAEIRQPKSLDGHMLALTWKITDCRYEGRLVFQTVCYQHSSPQTQDIARKFLKDLCVALDITEQVTDPETFKFKPAKVRVVIEVDKSGRYDDQNRIRRVWPLTDSDGEAAEAKAHIRRSLAVEPAKPRSSRSLPSSSPTSPQNSRRCACWCLFMCAS